MRNHNQHSNEKVIRDVTAQGMTVRLIFAAQQNCEVPAIVGKILKNAYLQRQGA